MPASVQLAYRFPPELMARIEHYARILEERNPGLKVNNALVVRSLITYALDQLDPQPKTVDKETKAPSEPKTKTAPKKAEAQKPTPKKKPGRKPAAKKPKAEHASLIAEPAPEPSQSGSTPSPA